MHKSADGTMPDRLTDRRGRVLVVDDSMITTESLRQALIDDFAVDTADSGEDCLARLASGKDMPDLILLDIEMGGIDGFETCRRLRAGHDMPVIFVSAHDDLAERIKAFDSGGDDFVVKPFEPEVIRRKAQRMVERLAAKQRHIAEKEELKSISLGYQRNLGDTGVLLDFIRRSGSLTDYEELARRLLAATAQYGVRCHVQIRHEGVSYTLTPAGVASPLEESVLERSVGMGRIFQFSRRLVVNYSFVSILILDLPAGDAEIGRLRDNIAVLAESAEAVAETIAMRKESGFRAEALQSAVGETATAVESLRELYRQQQHDARQRLQDMIDGVEKAYVNLGLTDRQEQRVSNIVRQGAENTLMLFDVDAELDRRFAQVLDALRPQGAGTGQSEVW